MPCSDSLWSLDDAQQVIEDYEKLLKTLCEGTRALHRHHVMVERETKALRALCAAQAAELSRLSAIGVFVQDLPATPPVTPPLGTYP